MKWMKPGGDDAIEGDLVAMRRYARSLARDDHDADDVVQDALLRAIERQQTYEPEHSREQAAPHQGRRRWLLAIVHNVFISGRRRAAAEARRDAGFAETLASHIDPEQEHRARLADIARAFAALPDHHRAVAHLILIEGLSYQDAADVLDVPIGTVMSRLARARAALRSAETAATTDISRQAKLRVVGGTDD